jgi:hypothetical protein
VNLVASLPGAVRALLAGKLHSRVPATILIAIGAFIPTITDSLNRAGDTAWFEVGKFLGIVFLLAGFLVSIEVFREIRVPFTQIRLSTRRRQRAAAIDAAAESAAGVRGADEDGAVAAPVPGTAATAGAGPVGPGGTPADRVS